MGLLSPLSKEESRLPINLSGSRAPHWLRASSVRCPSREMELQSLYLAAFVICGLILVG
jgi:hypothetical protein